MRKVSDAECNAALLAESVTAESQREAVQQGGTGSEGLQIPVQGVGILPVQFEGISARVRAEVPLGESSTDAPTMDPMLTIRPDLC